MSKACLHYTITVKMTEEEKQVPAVRPGIQTSEFWLALVATVAGGLSAAYATEPWAAAVGVVASALASMGYGFARASVKKTQ